MIKPTSSLFAKILSWFFLNLILVVAALAVFFAFQPQVNLYAIFGQEGSNRLQTATMLIVHDLNQTSRTTWSEVLARHAAIHQVDFVLMLGDGSHFSSKDNKFLEEVIKRVRDTLPPKPPPRHGPPPPGFDDPHQRPANHAIDDAPDLPKKEPGARITPMHTYVDEKGPHLMMRTRQPTRYWAGIRIPLPSEPLRPPPHAFVFAVSDSITGNGFFFDPVPWMVVAATVILISVLFWIPMVKHITRPLSRMTLATEEVANGRFEVNIHEPRADEIGRLARAISHMSSRLSAFVKGQKRFLGDVAHELGSPIARIQFGLGALEQRVEGENRKRVIEVMEDIDHLSKLVNELLAFSRADLKSNTVRLEKIDLLPVVQAAVKREGTPAVTIITKIDPEIHVVASAELLTRALANLIRNAVKYAGDAGPIDISAEQRVNAVEIEVLDSGPGVPEDLLAQLFEPFFRPEASRDRYSGGVGLGLAIVKTCVETCNGTVYAYNRKPNGFAVTITLGTIMAVNPVLSADKELNVLTWCDHTDPALLKPFEQKHNVRINMKEYDGTGVALALLEQSQPGDWDVFVVDSIDVRRVVKLGLLEPLDTKDFAWNDIFPEIRPPELHNVNDKLYAVPEKFGYNTIAYNNKKADPADMRDAAVLWNPKYKGRIAVYDFYIPVIEMVAIGLGIKPSELNQSHLPAIKEKLFKMKELSALVGDVVQVQTALATGEVDIIAGGGEFAVSVLHKENPALDWVLPNQGGVRWQQAIGVFAASKKKDLAVKFVQYILSPEGQGRLATSSCYWAMPVNSKAVLTPEQKKILRWDEQPKFLANSYFYLQPDEAFDKAMLDVWTEFLQH